MSRSHQLLPVLWDGAVLDCVPIVTTMVQLEDLSLVLKLPF